MSTNHPAHATQTTTHTLHALRGAVAAIDAIGDPQQALERADDLIDCLQAVAQDLNELRVRKAAAIAMAQERSLAHLAHRPAHQRQPPTQDRQLSARPAHLREPRLYGSS